MAPAAFVVALLVLATSYSGAFAVQEWAPPALFMLILLVATAVSGGGAPLPNRWLVLALGGAWGLAGWAALSATWASSPAAALQGAAELALYAAVITVPLTASRDPRLLRVAGRGVMLGIAGIGAYTLTRVIAASGGVFLAGRLNDPIGYRNATALLFSLPFWPLIVVAGARGPSRSARALAFGLAELLLGLALLTQSRGVLLGLACGGAVALALGPNRVRRAWLAVLAVVLLGASSHWLLRPWHAYAGGHGVVLGADVTAAGIALLALTALAAALGFALAVFDVGLRPATPAMESVRRVARTGIVVLVLAALAVGLVAVGSPVAEVRAKWREFTSLQTTTSTATRFTSAGGQRYDLWRVAAKEFSSHPLVGVGEGSYQFDYYRLRRTDRNLDDPHGLLFQLAAELGLVGVVAFLALVLGLGGSIARGWRSASADTRRLSAGACAAGVTFLGQSMVDWMWRIPGVTSLGLLCLAVAAGLVAREAAPRPVRRWPWWRRALAVAGLLVPTVLVGGIYLSDMYARDARDHAGLSPAAELSDARVAARLDPFATRPHYLEASALESAGQLSAARAQLVDASRLEPANFVPIALLGDFAARRGRYAQARAYYRRALAMDPLDVGLALLARSGGRPGS